MEGRKEELSKISIGEIRYIYSKETRTGQRNRKGNGNSMAGRML